MLRIFLLCVPLLASCATARIAPSHLGANASPTAHPGTISGRVEGATGAALVGAQVFLLDASTGYPMATRRPHTVIAPGHRQDVFDWWVATTDEHGEFLFEDVADGRYRLTAQSGILRRRPQEPLPWSEALDVVTLHGHCADVTVGPGRGASVNLRPLGDGVFKYGWSAPNDDVYLVVSAAAPTADPALGFIGWRGPFLRGALGMARMTSGSVEVRGLPRIPVHAAVFANDNTPGFWFERVPLDESAEIRSSERPVAHFSSGRQAPPVALEPLVAHVVGLEPGTRDAVVHTLLSAEAPGAPASLAHAQRNGLQAFSAYVDAVGPLDRTVVVEGCEGSWTAADVLAAHAYAGLAR